MSWVQCGGVNGVSECEVGTATVHIGTKSAAQLARETGKSVRAAPLPVAVASDRVRNTININQGHRMSSNSADKERQMLGLFLVPCVYLRVLGETVRQLGHNDRALYQGLDFTADDLKANDSRIFVTDATLMGQRALELAGKDGLSFHLAKQLRLTIHGTLGFAALTSPTFEGRSEEHTSELQLRAPFL